MSESTTAGDGVHVSGQAHEQPAVRRLARACIAFVRWQRAQPAAQASLVPESGTPLADRETSHD